MYYNIMQESGVILMELRHGFIHDMVDIKILILFILNRLTEPVDMDTLAELTLLDSGIGYFDLTECVASLTATGHISLDGGKYTITEKGQRNGGITESSLPYSVRIKAEQTAAQIRNRTRRDSMIKTSRTIRRGGGYDVTLTLSDGLGEIMHTVLFATDEKQAAALENGFREKAEKIYNRLIESILEN